MLSSRASLTVRFTVKSGDPPGAGKIWENRFCTEKMDQQDSKNGQKQEDTWYIPSEKIGQNIDPLRNSFFVANYQHWTSTSALEPFLGPLDPWGALGGPWVVWGGLTTPKLPFSFEDQFKPWN